MIFRIRHETLYRYTAPVSLSVNQLCLIPRSFEQQTCLSSTIEVSPVPDRIDSNTDCYGNSINHFRLEQPHNRCSIVALSFTQTPEGLDQLPDSPTLAEASSALTDPTQTSDLMAHDCLLSSPLIPLSTVVDELVASITTQGRTETVLGFAETLMHYIYHEFTYDPAFSTVVTPMSDVLKARKGVCQDFAHLAIAVLRRVGIPARYVSGYLETLPPPGVKKMQGADASHAWYSVFVPGRGWYDFDPTNNKRPDQQYITTGWGRDYSDISPLRGVVYGGGTHKLSVSVDVERVESTSL